MAGRKSKKKAVQAGASLGLLGMGASVLVAAAALATGSAVTAAPARADFEDLIDPIIQPLLSSFTDSLAAFDPAAAVDLTSWSDTFLNSLNSTFDFALPSADSAAATAAASVAEPAASTGVYDLPVTLVGAAGQPLTEPAVQASINGGSSVPLLVDTGSSGLVIPYTDLDTSNSFNALLDLFKLGTPEGSGISGYSGGVEYYYLTYNVPISYADGLTTDGPVSIEVYSYDPSNFLSYFTNSAFQEFLDGNGVSGILGIGPDTAGPTTSPFESYGGVLVDLVGTDKNLIVGGSDPLTGGTLLTGSPIVAGLTEKVFSSTDALLGSGTVTNDLDTGGVYGTIPSSIAGSGNLEGDTISVYQAGSTTPLYSYVVGAGQSPTVISGSSIDSGYIPFLSHEAYFDYAKDTTYWGPLTS